MARGSEAKNEVFTKIMEVFPKAFWEDEGKILRIPVSEGGNLVEIKVTLTAAKNILGGEENVSAFKLTSAREVTKEEKGSSEKAKSNMDMTQAEKDNVANLISALGL